MKALVIDDHEAVRQTVRDYLDVLEIPCDVACDGAEGLALMAATPYDLAVIDFVMPGLNGLEVADRARALSPRTKIVIMSGAVPPNTVATIRTRGHLFLQKPFNLDSFSALIRHVTGPAAFMA